MRTSFLLAFAFMLPGIASGQIFGPSNYEDCVLRGIKDAKSDAALATLQSACRGKFPERPTPFNDRPKLCLLSWDGLRTNKLSAEPRDWKANFKRFEISIYEMPVAHIFVPRTFKESPEATLQMYEQVSLYCR